MNDDPLGSYGPVDATGTIPRCRHGHILLGCPHDDCEEQNTYLAIEQVAVDLWHTRQQAEARRAVRASLGLPEEPRGWPETCT